MKTTLRQRALVSIGVATCAAGVLTAGIVPVDLNSFTADPASAVTISNDGSRARFTEDELYSSTVLYLMDLSIPGDAYWFSFAYDLAVAQEEENYFDFYFYDLTAPRYSAGGYAGSYAGQFGLDLVAYRGLDVPILLSLSAGWDDPGLESTLEVWDLWMRKRETLVPDGAATSGLLMLALLGLWLVPGLRCRSTSHTPRHN